MRRIAEKDLDLIALCLVCVDQRSRGKITRRDDVYRICDFSITKSLLADRPHLRRPLGERELFFRIAS